MRTDIQCLRGIAIISVLIYHLFPSIFANGFLGVDIFFVLSGFLMGKNLDRHKIKCIKDILSFYYRRFRRILPLYYLVVLFIVIAYHVLMCESWWTTNTRYAIGSLFVGTNQLIIHDSHNYFQEFMTDGSSLNAFIHLWSLGVEMQFYFFVPFFFIIGDFLFKDSITLKLAAAILATCGGFTAFALIEPQFAFNFMPLRLWQFFAGIMAVYLEKIKISQILPTANKEKVVTEEDSSILERDDLVNSALVILSLCFLPYKINVLILRPIITLTTAIILSREAVGSRILNSPSLCYVGDISYVVYLVHWPVIVMVGIGYTKVLICSIIFTILLSVLIHHLYEKVYLQLNISAIIPLVIGLILANAYLQYSTQHDEIWKRVYEPDIQKVIDQNKALLPHVWVTEPMKDNCTNATLGDIGLHPPTLLKYCLHKPSNGKLKVLMVGNSFVYNTAERIRNNFNYNYSHFEYFSAQFSYGLFQEDYMSSLQLNLTNRLIEMRQPDILFINAKHQLGIFQPFFDPETDDILNKINENIKFLEKHVKQHIYILNSTPQYSNNLVNFFLQYITERPEEIEKLHLSRPKTIMKHRYVRKRLSLIKCTKCTVYDIAQVFADGDKYLSFNRESLIAYWDNTVHITGPGLDLVEPIFKNITRSIMDNA